MRMFLLAIFLNCVCNWFAQPYNYYFGNLHAHTGFSDGNKDSASTGVSVPATSYAYAKLSDNFDFLGISEHNHFSSSKNPGFKRAFYQTGLNMANAANQDGSFVSLFGMEYGVSSQYNGHILIYGFNQLIGWENSTPGDPNPNYDLYNPKTDYDALFKKIKNNSAAFGYLAHPDFSDFTTDGTYETALSNAPYNAAYDSAIVGMPLRSGLANSTNTSYSDYSTGNYFNYYKKLLYQGYHLGIGYDHDNHYTNFGRSNGGRLVILAPSLTRADLYTAMKQMHFYGSDDANVKVDFNLNGSIMGSVTHGNTYPTFQVVHSDPDGEQADTIRIWKGYKESGGLWAWIAKSTVNNNTLLYTDNSLIQGQEYYYFAEIRQKDGQWIVTSPIWYTYGSNTAVPEEEVTDAKFVLFPNPANDMLYFNSDKPGPYHVVVKDALARIAIDEYFPEESGSLSLSSLKSGVYLVRIDCKWGVVTRRICVDH